MSEIMLIVDFVILTVLQTINDPYKQITGIATVLFISLNLPCDVVSGHMNLRELDQNQTLYNGLRRTTTTLDTILKCCVWIFKLLFISKPQSQHSYTFCTAMSPILSIILVICKDDWRNIALPVLL